MSPWPRGSNHDFFQKPFTPIDLVQKVRECSLAREAASSATALSRNMDGVATSATLALLEVIQRRRSEGRTVLDLGLGEPVFPARSIVSSAHRSRTSREHFASRLLEACDVAVIPGEAFGVPHWVRASFSGDIDAVREDFTCLAQFLQAS